MIIKTRRWYCGSMALVATLGFCVVDATPAAWLYDLTPGVKMVVLIRVYQADLERITTYVPPEFKARS